jgi:hypothetical protein
MVWASGNPQYEDSSPRRLVTMHAECLGDAKRRVLLEILNADITDDGIPGALHGYFAAHARSMEPVEESYSLDSGPGALIARDQNATVILPRPSTIYRARNVGFGTDPNLMAMQNRVLWITGQMTPLARQQLTANGWSVREGDLH